MGLLALLLLAGCGRSPDRLDGAGSSFVDPIMQEWAYLYHQQHGIKVNYQSRGSGAGVDMMTNGAVDFGCTDAYLSETQLALCREKGGEVIHVPLCLGAIVPAYNLPGNPEVRFTGQVLADIYTGKIRRWNDPALVALNPGVSLPDQDLRVVWRSDSSGSTSIWTDFLNKSSAAPNQWDSKLVGTSIQWPRSDGVGQKGTDGVAGFVKRNPYALGYIELSYALSNQIPFGAVQNRAGEFIRADLASVTAASAAKASSVPDDLRYSLVYAPGKDSYPISGTTWAVVYVRQPARKVERLRDFLSWLVHDGQEHVGSLDYAPLPKSLVERIDRKLELLRAAD
jgi:phosphate transport system substrate-binding protein